MKTLSKILILVGLAMSLSVAGGTYFSKFSFGATTLPLHYGLSVETVDQPSVSFNYVVAHYDDNTIPGVSEDPSLVYRFDGTSTNAASLKSTSVTVLGAKCFTAEENSMPSFVMCFYNDGSLGIVWYSKIILS